MKQRIVLIIILLCLPLNVWAAAITSAQSGNWSDTTTWVGGVKPGANDTAIIATGHTVVVDENTTVGSNAGAVGHAITIQATNASIYGALTVNAGVTLTLRGYDLTTNTCMAVNQYGKFEPASSSTVLIDLATDNGSAIINNGRITADGVTFGIPVGNINWSNASGNQVISNRNPGLFDYTLNIYGLKIFKGATVDPGPIANAAGTGLGAFGDSSFVVVSSTNGPVSEVGSYAAIVNTGDYYIDYPKGVLYYKSTGNLSITFNYKHASWFGGGIQSQANTAGSSISITNSIFNWFGSYGTQTNEYNGGTIIARYKSTIDSDRAIVVNNNTFNYCSRAIQAHTITTDATHYLTFTGNIFNYVRNSISNFDGIFNIGYTSYYDINANIFNSFSQIFCTTGRSSSNVNGYVRNNTGLIQFWKLLNSAVYPSYFEYNTLTSFGGMMVSAAGGFLDAGGFEFEGSATGSMHYRFNTITAGHRVGRIGNYMVIQDNKFDLFDHHGIVHRSGDGFITGYILSGNIITKSKSDMSGGWTLGYNKTHWVHDVDIKNNTFDTGLRSINFNDQETTIALGTRLRIYNNIASSSTQGIYLPANSSTNISKLAIERLDYNNDYANTTTPTNVKQATFVKSAVEYHTNTRNIPGVYLHSPSYTLPQTDRDLVMTVTGTPGTDLSVTLAWGGGPAVELVATQGTATGGTAATTHTTPGTLIKTSAGWATTYPAWHKARQVKTISGTGSGQHAMVKSNTADTLTVLPNNVAGTWTAPDATTVFVVFESEVTLTDGAGGSVQAGVYTPDLVITAGTYTDATISIESHTLAVDPQYNTAYAPANLTLKNAGFGGVDIGAVAVQVATTNRKPSGYRFNYGLRY